MVDHMLEPPRPVRRLEVITGAGGRRRWSADEKARILEETMAPGVVRPGARRTILHWPLPRLLLPLTCRNPLRQTVERR
ncbi:hypothetical protein J4G37_33215 [Microvirga sp. 3-52]|nr:hypothetical protein [Microvirga sp. 3-52]